MYRFARDAQAPITSRRVVYGDDVTIQVFSDMIDQEELVSFATNICREVSAAGGGNVLITVDDNNVVYAAPCRKSAGA